MMITDFKAIDRGLRLLARSTRTEVGNIAAGTCFRFPGDWFLAAWHKGTIGQELSLGWVGW